jgi:hypothetical protein
MDSVSEPHQTVQHTTLPLRKRLGTILSKMIPDALERGLCRSAIGFLMAMAYVPKLPKRMKFGLCKTIENMDRHIRDIPMSRARSLYVQRVQQSKSLRQLFARMVKSPLTSCMMVSEELARNAPALAFTFCLSALGMQFVVPAAIAVGGVAAVQAFGEVSVQMIDDQRKDKEIGARELYAGGATEQMRHVVFNTAAKHGAVIGASTAITFAAGVGLDYVFGNILPKNLSVIAGKSAGVVEKQVSLKAVAGALDVVAGFTEQKLVGVTGAHPLANRTTAILGGVLPGLVG